MKQLFSIQQLPALLAVVFVLAAPVANAALFEDGEARIQINNLNEKIKSAQSSLIELNSQNELLKNENSALRGRIEQLEKNAEETTANLRATYQEINDRLKKFEPQELEIEGIKGFVQSGEKEAYDSALKLFQAGNLTKAETELSEFSRKYPNSPFWPLSQYWLANTKYANKDYSGAIAAAQSLIKRYPDHSRAPDSLITIASCQIESHQKSAAKKTLETILSKFSDSKSAKTAKEMLGSLK